VFMKKIIKYILVFTAVVVLTACSGKDENSVQPADNTTVDGKTEENVNAQTDAGVSEVDTDTEWVVYWYLCGSDLESNYAAATNDLAELLSVELPENVKVVIQTGGTSFWQNDLINADTLGRYLYDHNGFQLIEELPSANMGDVQTLRDFLLFGRENYPAKRTAVVLWNHGGGSVSGASFDELYGMDSLSLAEMYEAFTDVFGSNPQDQPVDIIGFDTCLMATIDTAYTFSDIAKYLVASQETEPGNGWLYSGWIGALKETPDMEPVELAKVICDSFMQGCMEAGTEDNITLSVTDLSRVSDLMAAYDDFGREALVSAIENPAFFARFSKIANSVENYGGNTREQGYTNMADLGSIALKSGELLPETYRAVVDALSECVVYKVNGKYRPESAGLSCYYSYNGDVDDFISYMSIGPSESFKYLYAYGLTGELPQEGMDYISGLNYSSLPQLHTLDSVNWDNMPVTVDANGNVTLTLGIKAIDILSSLTFELYYVDPEEDIMLCLGTDNDIIADWENGIFKDNFRGVWGSLDGALCYMEIAYEGDTYNLYSIPILLNGEDYNLLVVYDFETGEYGIEGARKPLDESGAADKNLRYLVEGDEIQTVHFANVISSDSDELLAVPIDTLKVTADTAFAETELGDGIFIMIFVMKDSQGNVAYSAPVTFESSGGEIVTSAGE
jgi:Clostripain family.